MPLRAFFDSDAYHPSIKGRDKRS